MIGDVLLPPRRTPASLPPGMLVSDSWDGIRIDRELGEERSVQARTAQLARRDASWVATDHGSGELADFISVSGDEAAAKLAFFHCKGAGGKAVGRRVNDLYEVIGQVVKCVPWTLAPAGLWSELVRRLDQRTAFRLVYGDADSFRAAMVRFANSNHSQLMIDVVAVQPGVSVSDLDDWAAGRALLHAADGWSSAENVRFRFLGSP